MKLKTRTGWILGSVAVVILAFAVVFAIRRDDQITLHLVDKGGKPVNGSVRVDEYRNYPVLSSLDFLPKWLRQSKKSYGITVRDGALKTRRLRSRNQGAVLIFGERPQAIVYTVEPDGRARLLGRSLSNFVSFDVDQPEVSMMLD